MESSGSERGMTRREFLKGAAAAAAAPYVIPASALGADGRAAPSGRIAMGAIGVGSMGGGHFGRMLGNSGVQVLAVCDVDSGSRRKAKENAERRYGGARRSGTYKGFQAYNDFRDLLARDDIDAVLIAVPDHWHAIISVRACKAGKDVYCEKPLCLTVREGREMVRAARRYGRVFSSGSQRVLGDYGALARCVRGGGVGEVKEAYVSVGGPSRACDLPAEDLPDGLDWEMWLGPAPWRPFNKKIHPYSWRSYRDYSGGGMTDWGAHKFAAAMFAMELEKTGPVEVVPPDRGEHKLLTYRFANGIVMYHRGGPDITIRGTEGEASRKNLPPTAGPVDMPGYKGRGGIFGDFLHCIRTRERPFRDVELAHRAATVCHLGNIAYWLGRGFKWDPEKEEIIGDAEAGRWLDRPKRAPWRL